MAPAGGTAAAAPSMTYDSCIAVSASTETAGDVVVGPAILGRGENLAGRTDFHEFSHEHESRDVRHAGRLLQIMSDHHDTIFLAQRLQGFFDPQGGNGIERR